MALTYYAGIEGPVVRPMSMPPGGGGGDAPVTQVLAPSPLAADGPGLDITAFLAAAGGTLLLFPSTGAEVLLVLASGAGVTVTVGIGTTILGQPVAPFPAVTLAAGHLTAFGPFHSLLQIPGTRLVQVTLSTVTGVQAGLVQNPVFT